MAQVVHELWVSNDPAVMIMPGGMPVGVQEVSPELTKYLDHGWPAIIASDVDGTQSLPLRIDTDVPNLVNFRHPSCRTSSVHGDRATGRLTKSRH